MEDDNCCSPLYNQEWVMFRCSGGTADCDYTVNNNSADKFPFLFFTLILTHFAIFTDEYQL